MRFFRLCLKTESHCLKGELQESRELLLLAGEKYITEEKLPTRWLSVTQHFALIVFLVFFVFFFSLSKQIKPLSVCDSYSYLLSVRYACPFFPFSLLFLCLINQVSRS